MEWRDVPGFPGYQVSERGKLRKASGYELGRRGTRYVLSRGGVRVRLTTQELIALAWVPEPKPEPEPAAPATSRVEKAEPKPIEPARHARRAIRQYGHGTTRRCHDCGRPTNDYRCPKCWARQRGSAADMEESEWNAL